MKALSIRVFGTVQGVYFRASTKKQAEELGLTGWCQNEIDGTVLIHVEGEEEALSKMLSWCFHGPPMSSVKHLEQFAANIQGYSDFQIRR